MFVSIIASLLLTATTVLGQSSGNAFTQPLTGAVVQAGSDYTISWDDVTGSTVNIDLGDGPSGDVTILLNIATGIANTGTFSWPVPASIAEGTDYTLKISWANGTDYNFSDRFTIDSTVTATTSSSTSTSTTTSSSSTATSSTTTTSGSASVSASASASASGSASGASTQTTVTRSTATGATAAPPSGISSKATRFASSNFAGVFVLLAALAVGMMVVF